MRNRAWNRARAKMGNYFWLPCPLCGQEFGGHELRDIDDKPSGVPDPAYPKGSGRGIGICPDCTRAGRGRRDSDWYEEYRMTMSDFLLARIAEDEVDAKAAIAWSEDPEWIEADRGVLDGVDFVGDGPAVHIVRWWKRRIAECEAKRRIVGYATPSDDFEQGLLRAFADPATDATALAQAEPFARLLGAETNRALGDVLRLLALPYAEHPDYREEWRP